MLNNIEFILKIIFLILSIIWIGKIMVSRSDKQIVINPVLIGISAILVIISEVDNSIIGISIKNIRIFLYLVYTLTILLGLYAMRRKNGIF